MVEVESRSCEKGEKKRRRERMAEERKSRSQVDHLE